jgi:hypothetical protein
MKHYFYWLLLLAACGGSSAPPGTQPQGTQRPTTVPQGEPRTMITRPLMATSPQNLLRDPALGGNSGFLDTGTFLAVPALPGAANAAFFATNLQPLTHTFRSASPVGGTAAITELRSPQASDSLTGATIVCSFMGGPGNIHASIWLSAGDADANPVAFAAAERAFSVWLLAGDGTRKVQLQPAASTVTYRGREWIQYSTAGDSQFPFYGWLAIELTDLRLSLQLALPEVTSSALGGPSAGRAAPLVAMTTQDLRLLARVQSAAPRHFPRPDRAPR